MVELRLSNNLNICLLRNIYNNLNIRYSVIAICNLLKTKHKSFLRPVYKEHITRVGNEGFWRVF